MPAPLTKAGLLPELAAAGDSSPASSVLRFFGVLMLEFCCHHDGGWIAAVDAADGSDSLYAPADAIAGGVIRRRIDWRGLAGDRPSWKG